MTNEYPIDVSSVIDMPHPRAPVVVESSRRRSYQHFFDASRIYIHGAYRRVVGEKEFRERQERLAARLASE